MSQHHLLARDEVRRDAIGGFELAWRGRLETAAAEQLVVSDVKLDYVPGCLAKVLAILARFIGAEGKSWKRYTIMPRERVVPRVSKRVRLEARPALDNSFLSSEACQWMEV